MKKYIIAFAIAFCSISGVMAQSSVSAGFIYGLANSTFGGLSSDNVDPTVGSRLGVSLNLAPTPTFSIEPQFLVTNKGADVLTSNGVQQIRLDYAELPILFNLRLPIGETIYPKVFIGPYVATRISEEQVYLSNLDDVDPQYNDISVKDGDMGIVFGGGIELILNRLIIGATARYDYGVVRIGTSEFTPDLKNRVFTVNGKIGFVLIQ
ncbi:outer membrane beta-barrel protein [Sanyastnella coralliicola]|uniref:outer membrane beta-barrel protein n=1 Tax=Sanyastnella coralliicola TaxID=3069118 RepID=UPI0027B904BA|nr:outer membrane beta-barrel protein [Longitalea sp. SCSIO 12813]